MKTVSKKRCEQCHSKQYENKFIYQIPPHGNEQPFTLWISHILEPRAVLRIVRQVRSQWLPLSFSTFNSEPGRWESLQLSWAGGKPPTTSSKGNVGPKCLEHSGSCQGPRVWPWSCLPAAGQSSGGGGGILLVPSVPWKSPASASTREKAVDRRHPAGRLLACRKRPWAPRGLTSAGLQGGARLSVKLTLQGKALKAQLYKGTGNAA